MSTQSAPISCVEAAVLQPVYSSALSVKQRGGQTENPSSVHWCGRCVTRHARVVAGKVFHVFICFMNIVAEVADHSVMLNGIFRKLDDHILPMIEQLRQIPPAYFKRFSAASKCMMGVMDFMGINNDIYYFVAQNFKKNSQVVVCARTLLMASDISYGLLWLQELGLNKLSNIFEGISNCRVFNFVPAAVESIPMLRSMPRVQQRAAIIGNLRIFSFTSKITLNSFAQSTLNASNLLFAIQNSLALIFAIKQENKIRIIQASFDGLYYVSELALEGLLCWGFSNAIGLGVLALGNIVFYVASFSYQLYILREKQRALLKKIEGDEKRSAHSWKNNFESKST